MQPITDEAAITFFRQDSYRYDDELRTIISNMPPFPWHLFGNAPEPTAILMVQEFPHSVYAGFSADDEQFITAAINWLADAYRDNENFGLGTDTRSIFAYPSIGERFLIGDIGRYPSLVCTTHEPDYQEPQGCRLTEADRDAVLRYPQQGDRFNPGLQQHFEWCVTNGDGAVYALKDAGEILAYVACTPEFDNIWDIALIHVRDDCRHQGLGTRIAKYYAQVLLSQECIPYYSGATREFSEATARKAGFALCREIYSTKATLR